MYMCKYMYNVHVCIYGNVCSEHDILYMYTCVCSNYDMVYTFCKCSQTCVNVMVAGEETCAMKVQSLYHTQMYMNYMYNVHISTCTCTNHCNEDTYPSKYIVYTCRTPVYMYIYTFYCLYMYTYIYM